MGLRRDGLMLGALERNPRVFEVEEGVWRMAFLGMERPYFTLVIELVTFLSDGNKLFLKNIFHELYIL
jgi:hypothetical protein